MVISRYQVFRYALFAFLVGVALASFVSFTFFEFYIFFLCALGTAIIGRKNVFPRTVALILLMMTAGMWRVSADAQERFFVPPDAPFSFQGAVVDEPVLRGAFQTARLDIRSGEQSRGVMRVRLPLIPEVRVGDSLEGTCNHVLPVWESPGGVLFPPLCTRTDMVVTSADHMLLARIFSDSRHFFQDVIDRGLPSPTSDLLGGLLLGVDQTFSSELKENFRRSGVSHIVAVSGYNIMVIMGMMWGVLRYTPLSRRQSFWFLVCAIILFTGLTGAQPATVRATIMGLLILCAQYAGRQSQSGHALLVAATVMVAWDPSILLFDVGFQLSILATLGLIYLSPIVGALASVLPALYGLKEVGVQTFSAYLATAPLIFWTFHTVSLVAMPANLAILLLIPPAMALGFFWGIVAIVTGGAWITELVAAPVTLLLATIIGISTWFADASFAQSAFELSAGVRGVIVAATYFALIFFTRIIARRLRLQEQEGTIGLKF